MLKEVWKTYPRDQVTDTAAFVDEREKGVIQRNIFKNFNIFLFGLFRNLSSGFSRGKEHLKFVPDLRFSNYFLVMTVTVTNSFDFNIFTFFLTDDHFPGNFNHAESSFLRRNLIY